MEQETYFEDLPLSDDVLDALYDMRFEKCTPVQAQCIPPILEGRDVIGIAQTGTGKTAAYLLPLLTILKETPHPADAVNCLIMSPTRELAQQIDQALQGFGYYVGVRGIAVYGGNDGIRYEQERRSLQSGADIVIATPGRLLSHIDLGTFDLSRTTHLVLDEADRMLDMGFSDDILKIVSHLPAERQTILFSATMPEKIAELARTVMHDPLEVRIAVSKPAEGIRQCVYLCREGDKGALVKHVLTTEPDEGHPTLTRVIIFCSSKLKVKELNAALRQKGWNTAAMHSDLEQKERDDVMLRFKAGRVDILVATDIVSRGIDIDDITMVVNYDVPRDPEDYVHRIGRTARAGRKGRAVTLVSERDRRSLAAIEELLEKKVPREELPEGFSAPAKTATGSGDDRRRDGRRGKSGRGGNSRSRSRQGRGKADAKSANPATGAAAPASAASHDASATDGAKPRRKHRGGRRHRRPAGDKPAAPQQD